MNMQAAVNTTGIQFNTAYFSQEDIARLNRLVVDDAESLPEKFRLTPGLETVDLSASVSLKPLDLMEAEKATQEAMSILLEDDEFKKELSEAERATLLSETRAALSQSSITFTPASVATNNAQAMQSIQLVELDEYRVSFEVDGTQLFSVDRRLLQGPSFELVLRIAAVVLDVFGLLCTAVGIAIEHGSGWIKRIATFIKGIGQSMVSWATKIAGKFGPSVPAIETAHATGNSAFVTAVKNAAKEIATFVVNILKVGWKNRAFIQTIRHCFKCMFAGKWYQKAYYLLQLISSVILMIGTAGSSLILKLVLAVTQLCILIWDSILLAQLLSKKAIVRLRECFPEGSQVAGAAS